MDHRGLIGVFQFAILSFHLFRSGLALECYACENQNSNKDKCIKTTKQCEQDQDICMTRISWGLPPRWVPYGNRFHYVSKDCERKPVCEQKQADMVKHCRRDWFDDWSCIECCSGDLCNYYVTLGATKIKSHVSTTVAVSLFVIIYII